MCEHSTTSKSSVMQEKIQFPKHAFLIVLNEFCERFSYYGMKAVLALYLKNILNYREDTTTTIYHVFCTLCYFTPLFGGLISDSWLGKYRTILYLSILYTFGHGLLSLGAITIFNLPHEGLSVLGIIFVACGMGGIKPCVAAFGADQFSSMDKKRLTSFFSIFYFAINTGSLLSIVISPLLRKNVKCFGMDTCYPLSFGLPCILMIISIVLLASGKSYYTYKNPEENIFKKVIMCTCYALQAKLRRTRIKGQNELSEKSHWLECADGKYSAEFIGDLKQFYRILFILTPAPVFWSLFDQQGSKWLYMATKLNGYVEILGITLKPDQIQLLNPLLMLPLIVLFHKCIYPALGKFGWLKTNLQRMTVGGVMIGISFVLAGVLQMELDKESTNTLQRNESRVNFISNIPCLINIKLMDDGRQLDLEAYGQSSFEKVAAEKVYDLRFVPSDDENCTNVKPTLYKWKSIASKGETLFVTWKNDGLSILKSNYADKMEKNGEGVPLIRFAFLGTDDERKSGAVLKIKNEKNQSMKVWITKSDFDVANFKRAEVDSISVAELDSPTYRTETYWHVLELQVGNESFQVGKMFPRQGGNYLFVVDKSPTENKYQLREYMLTIPNKIHMLWLFPQYLLLTIAEVMFNISGCEFAFTEAPASMKSLLQAVWLLTVAFGNVIVIIFTKFPMCDKQFDEFFMYAVMMFIAAVSFAILTRQYKGINSDKPATTGQIRESPKRNTDSQDSSVMHNGPPEIMKTFESSFPSNTGSLPPSSIISSTVPSNQTSNEPAKKSKEAVACNETEKRLE